MATELPGPCGSDSGDLLERIDELAQWFTDNPNHGDIKDGLCVLVRDVAFAERERIAQHFDSRDKGAGGFYDPHEPAEIIRAMRANAALPGGEAIRAE